jgi:hypothetical protein
MIRSRLQSSCSSAQLMSYLAIVCKVILVLVASLIFVFEKVVQKSQLGKGFEFVLLCR